MKAALIYPHQLFASHPALIDADAIFLIEEPLFFGTDQEWGVRFHIQKLILHRASILAYAEKLRQNNHPVTLLSLDDATSSDEMLGRLPRSISEISVCALADDVLQQRLQSFCTNQGITYHELPSPNFLTPKDWSDAHFSSGKKPFMASFYESQRKRMNILLEKDGKPSGGRWSFDDENRKKLPKDIQLPPSPPINTDQLIQEAKNTLRKDNIDSWGSADHFIYPIDHTSAEAWLETFLKERFANFGTYEDALSTKDPFLFHSVLTPMLNIGLLSPEHVVHKALSYAKSHDIAINNVEGFIRQIIGWREFMKIMYDQHGRHLRSKNFFGFKDDIPKSIYQGRTGILPVDLTLQKLEKYAYSHHIERLMVMGNFFMLLRIKPDAVYQWFMEMYIDAYDWVMVPNIYGMSQFSDGGLLVTKPYISGSNYLRKMSDYKSGPWCAAWDSLFWTFIDDHREFFSSQYRMKMMLSHLNKMTSDKLQEHHSRAADVRQTLAAGRVWGENGLL